MTERDLLRDALASRERDPHLRPVTLSETPRPGVTCGRCGRMFEAPLVDTEGRVVIGGHVQGDPKTCHPAGRPVWDRRERRP